MKKASLPIIMEQTKTMMRNAYNEVRRTTRLPAFLMEGILVELLAEVRNEKNAEIMSQVAAEEEEESEKSKPEKPEPGKEDVKKSE